LPSIIKSTKLENENLIFDIEYNTTAPFYKENGSHGNFDLQAHFHTAKTNNEEYYNLRKNCESKVFFSKCIQ
jgi:hypothetical protein